MLETINPENILFLDIETVPEKSDYEQLDESMKKLWDRKAERIRQQETDTPKLLYERAGIYSEFGKIICISSGYLQNHAFRIKSFFGHDEKQLLANFATLLNTHFSKPEHLLCAHNGKEFDYPYIARRMLINGIKIPSILQISGKKPWEVTLLDTMEMWKFGDHKNYTSLDLLARIFNIPTPKDDIDGSMVANVYYKENDLQRIVQYCCKDVLTVFQVFRRFRGEPPVAEDQVIYL